MKFLKRFLLGIVILVVLAIAVVFFYLQASRPQYSGKIKLKGLQEEVEVFFDGYGVPHIYAQNAEDAYFALGYVHAQDRLFQMEMLRRAASGRLAEVLGPDMVKVDKLFRTLGINQFAKEHAQKFLAADTAAFQQAAHAYQRGINEYIHTGKTPIEFTIIGIPKTEFLPEDIYNAIGFMSFGFAEGLRTDPVVQKIKTELGEAYLQDFALRPSTDEVRLKSFHGTPKMLATDSLITTINKTLEELPVPLWKGSNGWVIAGDRTASGYPILANDTHIGFAQPAVWYEAHMEYPGFSFYGHHLAGIPFGLLGNNRFSGWGLTMFENDDTDFFIETINPDNASQVKFKGQWEDIKMRKEVIKIKGQPDLELEVKTSRHGAIMNGLLNIKEEPTPVALSWVLTQQVNKDLQAAYQLNHASNFEEARTAASLFAAPGLNIMYGDKAGNIAWWAVAKLPIRPKHVQTKAFLDGASGNDEYLGFFDFTKNPQAVNPATGFLFSANNQPDSVDGILYPGYYYPKARAGRIRELLQENKKWTIEDVKQIDLDAVSISHPDVANVMADVLIHSNNADHRQLAKSLQGWDGNHTITDTAPSVFYNLLSQMMLLSLKDELGQDAYNALMSTSLPKNSYLTFIQNDLSPWWDNVLTKDTKETRQQIIEAAADRTLALLRTTSGDQASDWTWGKIHTLTHAHPLSAVKPLDKVFNVGPYVVPGGDEVINNLHFNLDTTGYFKVRGGPALRKVTDFSDIENGITCSPTGQSGNVMSKHYDDQAQMFANGEFRQMLMNRPGIIKQSQRLLLQPQQQRF